MNFRQEDILLEELSRIHPGRPEMQTTSCAGVETLFSNRSFGYGQSMAFKSLCARDAVVKYMTTNGTKLISGPMYNQSMKKKGGAFDRNISIQTSELATIKQGISFWAQTNTNPRAVYPLDELKKEMFSNAAIELYTAIGASPYSSIAYVDSVSDEPSVGKFRKLAKIDQDDTELFEELRDMQLFSKTFVRALMMGSISNTDETIKKLCGSVFDLVCLTVAFVKALINHFKEPNALEISRKLFRTIYEGNESRVEYENRFSALIMTLEVNLAESLLTQEAYFFMFLAVFNPYTVFVRDAFKNYRFRKFYFYEALPVVSKKASYEFPMIKKLNELLKRTLTEGQKLEMAFYKEKKSSLALHFHEKEIKDALETFRRPTKGFVKTKYDPENNTAKERLQLIMTSYVEAVWKELEAGARFTVGEMASWVPCYLIQKTFLSLYESQMTTPEKIPGALLTFCLSYIYKPTNGNTIADLDVLVTRSYQCDSPFWGVLKTSCYHHHLLVHHQYTPPLIEWEGHDTYLEQSPISTLAAVVDPEPGSILANPETARIVVSYNDKSGGVTDKDAWIFSETDGFLLLFCIHLLKKKGENGFSEAMSAAVDLETETYPSNFPYMVDATGAIKKMPLENIAREFLYFNQMIECSLKLSVAKQTTPGEFEKELSAQYEKEKKNFSLEYRGQVENFISSWGKKLEFVLTLPDEILRVNPRHIDRLNRVVLAALMIHEPDYISPASTIFHAYEGIFFLSDRCAKIIKVHENDSIMDSKTLSNPRFSGSDYYYRSTLMKVSGVVHCDGKFMHPYDIGGMTMYFKKPTPKPSEKQLPKNLSLFPEAELMNMEQTIKIARTFNPSVPEIKFYSLPIKVQIYALWNVCKTHAFVNGFAEFNAFDLKRKTQINTVLCVSRLEWFSSDKKPNELYYRVVTEYEEIDTMDIFDKVVVHEFDLSFKRKDEEVSHVRLGRVIE